MDEPLGFFLSFFLCISFIGDVKAMNAYRLRRRCFVCDDGLVNGNGSF